jgi:ArsR family transcriptional regulator, arsenate/arsenite/antimonite-responsive transcriptional repressor
VFDKDSYFYNIGNMKVKTAVTALAALAQETRLSIFRLLVEAGPEGVSAGRIGETLKVPAATLSFHLKELARAGLASSRQERQFIYYAVDFERMAQLMTFLTQNCCQGMPEKCLAVVETALGRCCPPKLKPKPKRSRL